VATVTETPRYGPTILEVHLGALTLEGYVKAEHVLRFEAICHNTKALKTGRVLDSFPDIVGRLAARYRAGDRARGLGWALGLVVLRVGRIWDDVGRLEERALEGYAHSAGIGGWAWGAGSEARDGYGPGPSGDNVGRLEVEAEESQDVSFPPGGAAIWGLGHEDMAAEAKERC
jgi:hypothetical protein